MTYETIGDIYTANKHFRENLSETLASLSPDEAVATPGGEPWSIQQIVEHISMVESGVARICGKLLEGARADAISSDGSFSLSETFGQQAAGIATQKLEAPERVHPTGVPSIAESLDRLAASSDALDALRPDLERFDFSAHTFPHPHFGGLTAGEWLVLAGMHENRHREQIERQLAKIRD